MVWPQEGSLKMSGEPKHYVKTADSGKERVQGFCGTCGSHLYAKDPDGGRMGLRIGVIAERHELGKPTWQVWSNSAFEWAFDLSDCKKIEMPK